MKRFRRISAIILLVLFANLLNGVPANAFGRRNHATVAYIADQYLTDAARKAVQDIYQGESLLEYAVLPDEDRYEILVPLEKDEYIIVDGAPVLKGPDGNAFCYGAFFSTDDKGSVWTTIPHGWLADKDGNYLNIEKGECIWALKKYADVLRQRQNHSLQEVKLALHMVVHLVGDMHCPSHVHFTDGRDRNDLKYTVIYKGKEIRYHNIWDTNILVDRYLGGPADFAYYCDPLMNRSLSKKEALRRQKEIQKGSIEDWCRDVSSRIGPVFEPEPGSEITKDQLQVFGPLGREMILRAGYRLAALLNEVF
ncbi:MAG: S1/P1 nuclease [Bacteroidales bacterium]|nr:S1/P1 nuclease [Bacteroidales bacterium]MDD3521338.1 S1/P1 nuclease [Bacteroidales bacterium]MDD4030598.1 S1/P1 nuclease [Bacteroidales bacterium]MDD4434713.1 S1/P1 nuclease [Bacteroidales bacterium]MDD5732175.1 S1/P1 nuclease [Bacteroidales bacterium]